MNRRLTLAWRSALLSAVSLLVAAGTTTDLGASSPRHATLVQALLPVDAAQVFGFTTTVAAPSAQEGSGIKGCNELAREAFQDATKSTGLVSEVFVCNSNAAAVRLMVATRKSGKVVPGFSVPATLGSNAIARSSGGSTFVVLWVRGNSVEVTALNTELGSSKAAKPMTSSQEKTLVRLASEQNSIFVDPGPDPAIAAQRSADNTARAAGCPGTPATSLQKSHWSAVPVMSINPKKRYTATVTTDAGSFLVALRPDSAPQTVNNFVFLAQHHFFDCVTFHRVIPGFVDQTGDPTGTGSGGPGYTIPDEFPPQASNASQQYPLGSVAMANTGQANTGGSQWFVVTGAQGESLPNSYSLFGQVTSGMNVLQAINADGSASGAPSVVHRILKVTVSSQ